MGIGGSGASSCAAIAQAQGYQVTGCDTNPYNEFTQSFDRDILSSEHLPSHISSGNVDLLVISPAITSLDPDNPEIIEAKKRKIKVMTWQKFLGKYLMKDKFVIAVCGTHGKTTTTAMIGQLLEDGVLDPTVLIGTIVKKWGTNCRAGKSRYFVVEADEFNNNFLNYDPDIAVLTNIEMDHPEYFKDFTSYKRSFQNFLHKSQKMIIANLEDSGSFETLKEKGAGYGIFFKPILDYSKMKIDFPLKVPGDFNLLNASAAYQVGLAVGIQETAIQKSLMGFEGSTRRFELLGEVNPSTSSGPSGAKIYSDFAHHPTEIEKTLQAARGKYPDQKIWVIYQPHMFTRTKAFFDNFVKVFQEAGVDQIYIIDIYPSREKDTGITSSKALVEAIARNNVKYISQIGDLTKVLSKVIKKGDVLFFMGAGDIDSIAREFVKAYAK